MFSEDFHLIFINPIKCLNPFHATGLFLYLLKILENLWFSHIFKGYSKRPVA